MCSGMVQRYSGGDVVPKPDSQGVPSGTSKETRRRSDWNGDLPAGKRCTGLREIKRSGLVYRHGCLELLECP